MIRLIEKIAPPASVDTTLTLPLEQRIKSRLKVCFDNGADGGLFLPRGTTLKDGELLRSVEGYTVQVRAAQETISTVFCATPLLLARACYHLGNRHVPLQIAPDQVCYLHDHVLDEMIQGLGLQVVVEQAPFEPEPGAYGGSSHGHHH